MKGINKTAMTPPEGSYLDYDLLNPADGVSNKGPGSEDLEHRHSPLKTPTTHMLRSSKKLEVSSYGYAWHINEQTGAFELVTQ